MPLTTIAELDIHYSEEGAGPALLVGPENLHAASAYENEARHFADRFRVVSFDYPETGRSTRDRLYADEQAYDPWNYWADLACHLLMDLGIDGVYAMGAGCGAWTALHLAGRQGRLHDVQVRGVIADSALVRVDARTLHRSLDMREHYYTRRVEWLSAQHGPDWRAVVDADTARLRQLADRGGYEVPEIVLGTIRCPVLLTGNQYDLHTPGIAAECARVAGIVPDCTIHLASASGHPHDQQHPWMWSAPDAFRHVVDGWLAGVAAV